MDKLSQKELLDEGFLDKVRKITAPLAKGAAAVGGAIGAASRAGTSAGIGDVIGGAKAGYEKEKQSQKSKLTELDDTIEQLGYFKLGKERGRGDTLVVDVADLDYNEQTGEKTQGTRYSKPLVLQWDKDSKSFSTVKSPKGVEGVDTKPKPAAQPALGAAFKPETKPETKPQARPAAQPALGAAFKPETKPQAKPKARPAAQPALGAAFKPQAKPQAKPKPKPEARPAAQPALGAAFKGDSTSKPKPKPEAKPVQKSEPALGAAFKGDSTSKPKSDIFATKSKPEAGARGKKGSRGEKSDTPEAAGKRIRRALAAGRPASRGDVNILKKAGVKGSQTIGGVKLSNLTRRKLADSISQKNLMRQLTLLFK